MKDVVGPMLVLKVGCTFPALKSRRGDFEDWIISGLGLPGAAVEVVDVEAGEPLPPPNGHAGIVITGSHAMITDRRDWSERAADWVREAVERTVPVLGICYGHQLLAHALGGEVGDNPKGREFGTVEVSLLEAAHADPLLGSLPRVFAVQVGHTQSVLRLPQGVVRLASNLWDQNQAARFSPTAWGVQFHPEFDADIARAYITHFDGLLRAENRDTDELRNRAADTPVGGTILSRFALLTRSARSGSAVSVWPHSARSAG